MLVEGNLQTGPVPHVLLFGLDGLLLDASQLGAEQLGTPLNVYAPVYGLDKSYLAVCLSRGDCWFGQRRRIVGSVTYRW